MFKLHFAETQDLYKKKASSRGEKWSGENFLKKFKKIKKRGCIFF